VRLPELRGRQTRTRRAMLCVLSSICLRIDTSSFIVCGNKPVVPDGASTVSDSDCKLDRNGYKMWAVRFISVSHVDWAAEINSRKARGGLNRVFVYASRANTTVLASSTVQTTGLPGQWQYSRCLVCVYIRIHLMPLPPTYSTISEPEPNHVFPYRLILVDNNSAQNCLSQCSAFGYSAAGMEFGRECCM